MKCVAFTRPDGGVSIVVPVIARDDPEGFTEEDALARALTKDVPRDATDVRELDEADIPADRTFRNAWTLNGSGIEHDMAKARAIQLDRIRLKRDAALEALDVETIKAVGKGDDAERAKVEARKQTLRDLPQTIASELDAAQTPEELKAIQPEIDAKEGAREAAVGRG